MLWIVYLNVIPASLQYHNTQIRRVTNLCLIFQLPDWATSTRNINNKTWMLLNTGWTQITCVKYKVALKNMLIVHRLLWLRSEQWLLLWWLGLLDHLFLPTPMPSHTASALAGRWSCRWVDHEKTVDASDATCNATLINNLQAAGGPCPEHVHTYGDLRPWEWASPHALHRAHNKVQFFCLTRWPSLKTLQVTHLGMPQNTNSAVQKAFDPPPHTFLLNIV